MGTRALTFVYDGYKQKNGKMKYKPIINMYSQYDGYPSGLGTDLAVFLRQFTMCNGIPVGENNKVYANGMGCLAAQLVAHFKTGAGGFYLYPTDATDCGQDYEYHIYNDADGEVCVRVTNRGCNFFGLTLSDTNEDLFAGPVVKFEEFCEVVE